MDSHRVLVIGRYGRFGTAWHRLVALLARQPGLGIEIVMEKLM